MRSPLVKSALEQYRRPFSLARAFRGDLVAGIDFTDLDPGRTWGPPGLKVQHQTFNLSAQTPTGDPVTASGQRVGAVLDKSLGLGLGSNVVVNGDFATDTVWSHNTGWAISGGKAQSTTAATAHDLLQSGILGTVDYWIVAFTVLDYVSNTVGAVGGSLAGPRHAANGNYRDLIARSANADLDFQAGATFVGSVDDVSAVPILGNHARQTTANSRPTYMESGQLKWWSLDGIDDCLQPVLKPAAAITILAVFNATGASQNVEGSTDASNANRCYLSTDAGGLLAAGVGSDASTVIHGGPDIRGLDVVALLRFNGSVVELWLAAQGIVPTLVYSGAQNGSPTTTVAMAIGARNVNGTLGSFMAGNIYAVGATQRFFADGEVRPAMYAAAQIAGIIF